MLSLSHKKGAGGQQGRPAVLATPAQRSLARAQALCDIIDHSTKAGRQRRDGEVSLGQALRVGRSQRGEVYTAPHMLRFIWHPCDHAMLSCMRWLAMTACIMPDLPMQCQSNHQHASEA